jgi:hypothetical protein
MARAKKPGTPGKTTIPREVVKATTQRLKKAFKTTGEAVASDLVVVAQQHYLYLEAVERPIEIMPGMVEARFAKKGGARRTPLGRMVWTGNAENWMLQLYKWSDEWWDEDNEAERPGGTPEECIVQAVLGW